MGGFEREDKTPPDITKNQFKSYALNSTHSEVKIDLYILDKVGSIEKSSNINRAEIYIDGVMARAYYPKNQSSIDWLFQKTFLTKLCGEILEAIIFDNAYNWAKISEIHNSSSDCVSK
jgi:hypothetical protein